MHIAIVGAGPIGLEAALAAIERGHSVSIYERGRVGENLRDWGHVRLFSPFGMNTSERGKGVLRDAGHELPADDALSTGREFVDRYLVPLAAWPRLAKCIEERTTVVAIGRNTLSKRDAIGQPARAADGFRLLLRDEEGERTARAAAVLDCSGTYPNHRWLGAGGVSCPGERSLADCLEHRLPDVLGADRERFADRRTLLVGAGYSAATTIVALGRLAREFPRTTVTWITRHDRPTPVTCIDDDPLTERERLTTEANRLATEQGGVVGWRPHNLVERINDNGADGFVVRLVDSPTGTEETLKCDHVVANVGYEPDRSLYEELQVHECYASQGPIKLAATLLGEASGDCLGMTSPGPESLRNPEPNFFVLGAKSYGRDSRFLLRTGLRQIEDVFTLFDDNEGTSNGGG